MTATILESLSIEQFNPKKAELTAMAEKYRGLKINGVEDKEGYNLVRQARLELKNTRVVIEKTGKALRADAIAYSKKVIELEKELTAIISPTEEALEAMENAIDDERERIKAEKERQESEKLNFRISELHSVRAVYPSDMLKNLSDEDFDLLLAEKRKIFVEEVNAKLEEDKARKLAQEKLDQERKEFEEEKRKLREEQEKLDAEKRKQEEVLLPVEDIVFPTLEEVKENMEGNNESEIIADTEPIPEELEVKTELNGSEISQEEKENILIEKHKIDGKVGSGKEYFTTRSEDKKTVFLYKLVDSL